MAVLTPLSDGIDLTPSNPVEGPVAWPGGPGTIVAYGNFDGGSVIAAVSYNAGSDWVQGSQPATADRVGGFGLPQGVLLRVQLENAGASADVRVYVWQRPQNA